MATPLYRSDRGYTIVELAVTLALLALVTSLAAPSFSAHLQRIRMQAVLDGLTRDLSYARMAATRAGEKVEIRFDLADGDPCVASYEMVVVSDPVRRIRHVDLGDVGRGLCVRKNGASVLSFSSRGRPNWNYSFWVRKGTMVDSLTLNQLGRVHRWP